MTEDALADQLEYYRRRAGEYDATAYGNVAAAQARIERLVAAMRPTGHVLEIACGTGMWTSALAATAETVTATDAAPEALAIARRRTPASNVTFEIADVFAWQPGRRFGTIFFSAWLSHVPTARFGEFWESLRSMLADHGRVLFIDEPTGERPKETYVEGDDEIIERRLRNGQTFRIVKNFFDPDELPVRLAKLGWTCKLHRDDDNWTWLCGEARPSTNG